MNNSFHKILSLSLEIFSIRLKSTICNSYWIIFSLLPCCPLFCFFGFFLFFLLLQKFRFLYSEKLESLGSTKRYPGTVTQFLQENLQETFFKKRLANIKEALVIHQSLAFDVLFFLNVFILHGIILLHCSISTLFVDGGPSVTFSEPFQISNGQKLLNTFIESLIIDAW